MIHAHTPAPPNIFGFTKEAWTEERNDSTGELYEHWLPDYQSGLFDSVESAEAEARAMFPWIADHPEPTPRSGIRQRPAGAVRRRRLRPAGRR